MKKASIKILSYFLLTAAGIAIGGGGSYAVQLFTQPDDMAVVEVASVEPQADMDTVQLRVRGGQMEWFDGVRWNTAAAVADLKQNDPTEAESDAWNTLVQQRGAAREAQRQEALAQFDREQTDLTTGEKPVVRQPAATRQPSTSTTTTTPATGGTSTTTPPPAPPPTTTPTTPPPTTTPDPTPEWSGDYE